MEWLSENSDTIIQIVGAVITVASLITRLTETPKDDEWVKRIFDWFSILTAKDAKGWFKAPFIQRSKKR